MSQFHSFIHVLGKYKIIVSILSRMTSLRPAFTMVYMELHARGRTVIL